MAVKLYTKTGDKGESSLIGGGRVKKSDLVFEVLGTVDEVNAWIGLARAEILRLLSASHRTRSAQAFGSEAQSGKDDKLALKSLASLSKELMRVQDRLLVVGAMIAGSGKVGLTGSDVEWLERRIDYYQKETRKDWYTRFLLPGGVELAARIDGARVVTRRAERVFVKFKIQNLKFKMANQKSKLLNKSLYLVGRYLNRLSDYLFALRCYVNSKAGYTETEFKGRKYKLD